MNATAGPGRCKTVAPAIRPLRVVMVDGEPRFHLRDLLVATDHRPFFIRNSLLPLESVRKFLACSDKPQASPLLESLRGLDATGWRGADHRPAPTP